ncbi:MAG TPA: S-adenosylmethionine decarboxylase proenzyme [Bacteroidetes bacterium]|nr:S-adenosylmethionine decarboxylase proenzyme [Bacteroidota bacterium]
MGSQPLATNALGRQLVVEFYDCRREKLDDLEGIEAAMLDAALASGATVVEKVFHRFSPWGVSGVVVIAESHLAIHTWPEYGYAAVDLFTCGEEVDPMKGFEVLRAELGAGSMSVVELKRGILPGLTGHAPHKPPAMARESEVV